MPTKETVIVVNTEGGTVTVVIHAAPTNTSGAVSHESINEFYKEAEGSKKPAAATQGVFQDKIRIIWRPFQCADGSFSNEYLIQRFSPDGNFEKMVSAGDSVSYDDKDPDIRPNRHYEYRIFAVCKPLAQPPVAGDGVPTALKHVLSRIKPKGAPDRPGFIFSPYVTSGLSGSKAD
jgi:hypothetical protein